MIKPGTRVRVSKNSNTYPSGLNKETVYTSALHWCQPESWICLVEVKGRGFPDAYFEIVASIKRNLITAGLP